MSQIALVVVLVSALQWDSALANTGGDPGISSTSFTQMSDCLVDYMTPDVDVKTNASSIIDCATMCAQTTSCLSFITLSTASGYPYNCGLIDEKVDDCSELRFVSGARYYYKLISYYQPWKLVLSQERGKNVSGSRQNLIQSIKKGQQIRIMIEGSHSSETALQLYNAESVLVSDNDAMAQIFTFTYHEFEGSVKPLWTKLQANTSGEVTLAVANYRNFDFETNIRWFVKDTGQPGGALPVFVLEGMSIHQGSLDDVISLFHGGSSLQQVEKVSQNEFMSYPVRHSGFSLLPAIFTFNYWFDRSFKPFTHVSEMNTLLTNPTFFLVTYKNFDVMDSDNVNPFERIDPNFSWTGDYGWKQIYVNDHNGNPENGSYTDLVKTTKYGSEIRVMYQCNQTTTIHSHDIDRLYVDKETMTAYAYGLIPDPRESFRWIRYEINSNGTVVTTYLKRLDGREERQECQARISWFADKVLRKASWHYSKGNNATDHFDYSIEHFYKGLMPRVVVSTEDGLINSYSIQKMEYDFRHGGAFCLNYRTFNGSLLAVTNFDSRHNVLQNDIRLHANPKCLNEVYGYTPFSITWYV